MAPRYTDPRKQPGNDVAQYAVGLWPFLHNVRSAHAEYDLTNGVAASPFDDSRRFSIVRTMAGFMSTRIPVELLHEHEIT